MKNIFKDRSKLFKLIIFIVSLLLLFGLVWFLLLGNGFSFLGNNTTTGGKLGDKIYFSDSNKLMSVNVKTKETKVIDEGITSSYMEYPIGSQFPLNSKDFQSVAYVKNNSVWIYDGTKSEKINQPNIESKKFSYVLLSAWSPKSDYLIYNIIDSTFSLDPIAKDSPELHADDRTLGAYVYSFSTGKSIKLDKISGIILGWVPGSTKISYIKTSQDSSNPITNYNNVHYYDVASNKDSVVIDEPYNGKFMRFSDDNSRILYFDIDSKEENNFKYLVSKTDWSEPSVVHTVNRYDSSGINIDFLKGSFKYIAYGDKESVACDKTRMAEIYQGVNKGCYAIYLKNTKNDKKSQELIDWYGFYDFDKAVVLNGLDNFSVEKTEKTLALYNVESGETEKLYSSQYPVYAKPLLAIGDSLKIQVSGL